MVEQTFYMFRITVHKSEQKDLFDDLTDKREFLKQIVSTHPEKTGKRKTIWLLGNYTELKKYAFYFRFGRKGKKTLPNVDTKGDFIDKDIEIAPYAHCICDIEHQILTMSINNNLTQKIESQGKALENLINYNIKDFYNFVSVEIRLLPAYEDFLEKIRIAYMISKFWIKVKRPNLLDLDNDFVKPLSKLNDEINSKELKVEMNGEDLDRRNIEIISGSTTLAGSEGGAIIREEKGFKNKRIYLGKNHLKFKSDFEDTIDSKINVLEESTKLYNIIKKDFNIKNE